MEWAYGVTTVPERRDSYLNSTLHSLANAGFNEPRLFIDGLLHEDVRSLASEISQPITTRYPRIRAVGNWWLALWELYARNPHADRYAIFQDDISCVKNLREYLERCPFPGTPDSPLPHPGYLNLYTAQSNFVIVPRDSRRNEPVEGWYPSNQMGKGALGLVFNQTSVQALLTHPHFVKKLKCPSKGWQSIDGGVIQAMMESQMAEYVHYPSLVQHEGREPSISTEKADPNHDKWRFVQSPCFAGNGFDAVTLPLTQRRLSSSAFPRPSSPPSPSELRATFSGVLTEQPFPPPHPQPLSVPEVRFGGLVRRALNLVGRDLTDLVEWVRKSNTPELAAQRTQWAEAWAVKVLAHPDKATLHQPEFDAMLRGKPV